MEAIPEEDSELKIHPSIESQKENLFKVLRQLRSEVPESYAAEIYTKVLPSGPMRSNYASAALYTNFSEVDNRTRYALQLILVRYIITYGYNFSQFLRGDFSYAIHEKAFRWAGNRGTIGLFPWAILETVDVTIANRIGIPLGDYAIYTAIVELNPPSGEFSETGLLIRQYIDYVSQLWRPILNKSR